jgi:hypothetical protein
LDNNEDYSRTSEVSINPILISFKCLIVVRINKLCVSVKSRPANGAFSFANKRANAQKTKELFFANARTDKPTLKSKFDD